MSKKQTSPPPISWNGGMFEHAIGSLIMLETYIISCPRSTQLINHEVAKSIQKRKNTEENKFFQEREI
ncbi:MAG: hypothetical protein ACE5L7_04810 [Candidatus Aminicenantales bacterium]